jgi:hypothetical protein
MSADLVRWLWLLVELLRHEVPESDVNLVAFVTPGCRPRTQLIEGLDRAITEGEISSDAILFVVWAYPQGGWETLLEPRIPRPRRSTGLARLSAIRAAARSSSMAVTVRFVTQTLCRPATILTRPATLANFT